MGTQQVYDMLAVDRNQLSQEAPSSATKTPKASKAKKIPKGMSRELFNIIAGDNNDLPEAYTTIPNTPPVTESWKKAIHRDKKRRARKWQMAPFSPSAKPEAPKFLSHWSKADDVDKEYPFSKLQQHTFVDPIEMPKFSSNEYKLMPNMEFGEVWSEESTRHLMDLVSQFDMRFEILQYFWDAEKYGKKDSVDLRARFTDVYNYMVRLRNDKRPLLPAYDAPTERKRRLQLDRLQMRSQDEIDEHATLKEQERRIKNNREERERRQGAISMRISGMQSRTAASEPRKTAGGPNTPGRPLDKTPAGLQKFKNKKALIGLKKGDKRKSLDTANLAGLAPIPEPNLKFPEIKTPGVCVRSLRLKLPNSVSSKKSMALKKMIVELGLEENPMADEEAIDEFNKLRNDLIFLYELKNAMVNSATDLAHLKVEIGDRVNEPQIASLLEKAELALQHGSEERLISDTVDIVPTTSGTRYRRKTTVEQIRKSNTAE